VSYVRIPHVWLPSSPKHAEEGIYRYCPRCGCFNMADFDGLLPPVNELHQSEDCNEDLARRIMES